MPRQSDAAASDKFVADVVRHTNGLRRLIVDHQQQDEVLELLDKIDMVLWGPKVVQGKS